MSASGMIAGRVRLLGDNVNTDEHCSSKFLPGKDSAYTAQHAFERLVPDFAARFEHGDIVVAGANFGINSSREQAIQVLRLLGAAAVVARSISRQFFRNAINNGMPVFECDTAGISEGDEIQIDAITGRVSVIQRGIVRQAIPLPREVKAIIEAGGLLAFLQQHPDWKID